LRLSSMLHLTRNLWGPKIQQTKLRLSRRFWRIKDCQLSRKISKMYAVLLKPTKLTVTQLKNLGTRKNHQIKGVQSKLVKKCLCQLNKAKARDQP
jgi:hypothetical protein